jgi:dienelactone hydrolase
MRTLLFALLLAFAGAVNAGSLFTFSNQPGAHGVGVRYVKQYDHSRKFRQRDSWIGKLTRPDSARPIQTVIWYPAEKGGKNIRYDDYLALLGWETDFRRTPREEAGQVDAWLKMVTEGKRAAQVESERRKPMWAVREAAPVKGKYPVVIYAPSINNTAFENADLAEFLASHGYIVIASPTIGAAGRYIKWDLAHAEMQAADIRFLIDYARSLPQADMSRVAAAGFSWGGMTNILAASKDARIKALVSMDGAVRYYNSLVAQAKYAAPENLRTPLLYLAQSPASIEENVRIEQDLTGSFISRMTNADVYTLTMYPMAHVHFGSAFIRFDDAADYKEYTPEEVSFAYSLGARYVLNFLNAYLKGDAAGRAFLANRPVKNGAPPHSMIMEFAPAKGK